jgi:hypothetical protein
MQNTINIPYLKTSYRQLASDYIAILKELTNEQINQSPINGGWSAGQLISHTTKANQSSFLTIPGVVSNRNIGEKIPELEKTFLDFNTKMKSPNFILPDDKTFTKEECINKIKECFHSLESALNQSKLDEILITPLGALTKWEMANFVIYHSKRHLYQLKNIYIDITTTFKKQIASAFSDGRFEETFAYLDENILWHVVGENEFKGKEAVISRCKEVASYFASVTTNFVTHHIISEGNQVVVNGTGEFLRDGKRISFILASEWYEFNEEGKIISIQSFCIQEN